MLSNQTQQGTTPKPGEWKAQHTIDSIGSRTEWTYTHPSDNNSSSSNKQAINTTVIKKSGPSPPLTVYIHTFNYLKQPRPPTLRVPIVQKLRTYEPPPGSVRRACNFDRTLRERLEKRRFKDGRPMYETHVAVLVGGAEARYVAATVWMVMKGMEGITPVFSGSVTGLVTGWGEVEWGGFWCPCGKCPRCRSGRMVKS